MNKEQRIATALAFGEAVLAGNKHKGAKVLGKGVFATVYEVAGLAVKVQKTSRTRKWTIRSRAGEVLELIHYRQIESPHLPHVHAFSGDSRGAWVAVLEKLGKVTKNRRLKLHAVEYAARTAMHGKYGHSGWYADSWKKAPLPRQQKAGIMAAARQLAAAGFEVADVHSGNIMQRRTRIVLTDVVV